MPIPYLHHELFELNDGLLCKKHVIEGIGPIVVIDKMYKYPSDIELMLDQAWVPSFHYGRHSANYKDYYDCRHNIQICKTNHAKENEVQLLIRDMAKNYLGYEFIDEDWAQKATNFILEEKNFINCENLSEVGGDWADVYLKVPVEEYSKLEKSDCKGFIHQISRESWRTIVFPPDGGKAIIVNQFGV